MPLSSEDKVLKGKFVILLIGACSGKMNYFKVIFARIIINKMIRDIVMITDEIIITNLDLNKFVFPKYTV